MMKKRRPSSDFIRQFVHWARQCIALLRFVKFWKKYGRVPEEELAAPVIEEGKEVFQADLPARTEVMEKDLAKDRGSFSGNIEIQVYGGRSKPGKKSRKENGRSEGNGETRSEQEPSAETDRIGAADGSPVVTAPEEAAGDENRVFPERPTLLVIDDYEPLRQMIAKAMRGARYNVCTARDGVEGIVRIHENEIDLIITDVQMPRLDGFEMSKMLNVREKTREIPVIFLTEVLDERTKAVAKRLGAADTLIKPFTMDALFDSVQTILKTHTTVASAGVEGVRGSPAASVEPHAEPAQTSG